MSNFLKTLGRGTEVVPANCPHVEELRVFHTSIAGRLATAMDNHLINNEQYTASTFAIILEVLDEDDPSGLPRHRPIIISIFESAYSFGESIKRMYGIPERSSFSITAYYYGGDGKLVWVSMLQVCKDWEAVLRLLKEGGGRWKILFRYKADMVGVVRPGQMQPNQMQQGQMVPDQIQQMHLNQMQQYQMQQNQMQPNQMQQGQMLPDQMQQMQLNQMQQNQEQPDQLAWEEE